MKTRLSSSRGSKDIVNQGITCPDIILGFGHAATVPTTPPGPPRGRRNIVLHIREVWGKSKFSSSEIDFFEKPLRLLVPPPLKGVHKQKNTPDTKI